MADNLTPEQRRKCISLQVMLISIASELSKSLLPEVRGQHEKA